MLVYHIRLRSRLHLAIRPLSSRHSHHRHRNDIDTAGHRHNTRRIPNTTCQLRDRFRPSILHDSVHSVLHEGMLTINRLRITHLQQLINRGSFVHVLHQTPLNETHEVGRPARRRERRRTAVSYRVLDLSQSVVLERIPALSHLNRTDPEGPHITLPIRLSGKHFWSHVHRRATNHLVLGQTGFQG